MERHAKDKVLIVVLTVILCAIQVNSGLIEFGRSSKRDGGFLEIDRNLRIVGGLVARNAQFPHAAALVLHLTRTRNPSFCGGNIIHPNYILTAAHCLVRFENNDDTPASSYREFFTLG